MCVHAQAHATVQNKNRNERWQQHSKQKHFLSSTTEETNKKEFEQMQAKKVDKLKHRKEQKFTKT